MKKQVIILGIVSLFIIFASQPVSGQETENIKKKEEAELLKKKADEQKLKEIEAEQAHNQIMVDRIRAGSEIESAMREARQAYITSSGGNIDFFIPDAPDANFYISAPGSQSSTSLDFAKNVKEATFSKEFAFDVEKEAKRASISVSGVCKSGEIRIRINMPNGKLYTEVLIDEYGSVNWSKTFTIGEENGDKTGSWKFITSAKEATGNFRLSIKSF